MFSSALLVAATLAKLALAVSEGDLNISLQVASSVARADDLIVTAIVSNPTSEDICVLAINNVLDNSPTQSFDITTEDGSAVPFTGARATWDLASDAIYKTIPAGQSVAVNHTIGGIHDFSSFSAGSSFQLTPHAFNSILSSPSDESGIVARAEPVSFKVTNSTSTTQLFSSLGAKGGLHTATSTPVCSDGTKLQLIKDSLTYARSLAGGAATDINSHPNGAEYNRYFGGNTQSDIWWNFDRIAGDYSSDRNIYCASDYSDSKSACDNNPWIAYTVFYSDGRTPIYTCDGLANCGTTPSICSSRNYDATTSSRGGVILHELAHAVTGASDIAYGCSNTEKLNAADRKNNADNYRCMGLNIYLDYNC
ncbi:hypothetical protein CYLTODRAFT_414870 [Cylindrobasidium torrendii FP15055 ss-10]|uniref:Lysine-specific metallo-endopeptidase domain-containing protein n=1 Tax=Cylindrobasidium torrendii FP15055 ss-10 TaxID=1314674 RepID=A0A0D7AV52_9AGAR|nr:hypothetical protein CYLTODRAFT_414870 [Cylindrobasidium torrendii FP15055 ss-10]